MFSFFFTCFTYFSRFAERVVKLAELRTHLSAYLKTKMLVVAPNLYTLIGETVGARLITKAGYVFIEQACFAPLFFLRVNFA